MSDFTEEIGHNGQDATALQTSSRPRFADGGRVTLPIDHPSKQPVLVPTKVIGPFSDSAIAAFWSCAHRSGDSECWLWLKAVNREGYGRWLNNFAHRVAYVIANGQIQRGYTVDHTCGVRSCVNPAHLEAVSISENLARRGRVPSAPWPKRQRTAARYGRRRERGVCVQCNTPSVKYRCDPCRELHNAKDRSRKR